jgi:hypothetical protein
VDLVTSACPADRKLVHKKRSQSQMASAANPLTPLLLTAAGESGESGAPKVKNSPACLT